MKVIHVDFTQPRAHIRLARRFSRLTGIQLRRLLSNTQHDEWNRRVSG